MDSSMHRFFKTELEKMHNRLHNMICDKDYESIHRVNITYCQLQINYLYENYKKYVKGKYYEKDMLMPALKHLKYKTEKRLLCILEMKFGSLNNNPLRMEDYENKKKKNSNKDYSLYQHD